MLIELKELSPVKKEVEIEVPADAVQSLMAEITNEFARHAKIPGFRPGKVPMKVVRNKFQKEIQSETLERLLPKYFFEAVSERQLQPVGNPNLKHVDELKEESPLRFVAEFEVRPEVKLGEYKGLHVTEAETEVTDADIDGVIERLRDRAATFQSVSDRVAQDGDYLVVDIESSGEGTENRRSENYEFQLGENAPLKELSENLFGRKVGDKVSFEKSYGEDAPNEQVQGKTIRYDVELKEIRLLNRPEVDEQFVKMVGMGETVEELRAKIAEDLRRHKEHDALQKKKQEITDKLVSGHEFAVPEVLVDEELGNSMRNYARFLASQGVDLEQAQIDWEKVRDEFKPEAEKRVKRAILLEEIAKKENLEISDVEVDAEIRTAAAGSKQDFSEVKHRLRHDGGYESLRASMLQERALDLLLNEAKVVSAS